MKNHTTKICAKKGSPLLVSKKKTTNVKECIRIREQINTSP